MILIYSEALQRIVAFFYRLLKMAAIAVLISGQIRSFPTRDIINRLPDSWQLFTSLTSVGDRYFNATTAPLSRPITFCDDTEYSIGTATQIQWARIVTLFSKTTATVIIRLRPDIQFDIPLDEVVQTIQTYANTASTEINTVYIPEGHDQPYRNDHFAIAHRTAFEKYLNGTTPTITRFPCKYHLALSQAFAVCIGGDSGSGKSYIGRLLQDTLTFDQTVFVETDRYHKWERGAPEYTKITHLNPAANHLDRMDEDAFRLSLGEDVYSVDYDHATGKFTKEAQRLEARPFLVFCGLHTLYTDKIRDIADLKIFIDTDAPLRLAWKTQRDVTQRAGGTVEAVMSTITAREADRTAFIVPQMEHADIVIRHTATVVPKCRTTIGIAIKHWRILDRLGILDSSADKDATFIWIDPHVQVMDIDRMPKYTKAIINWRNQVDFVLQCIFVAFVFNDK